jgi:hypothetical protein
MTSTVQDVKSIALSGTDVYTLTIPTTGPVPVSAKFGLAVKYAAMAGTTGVTLSFQISKDGTNFVASALPSFTVIPTAVNTLGYNEAKMYLVGPNKLDTIPIVAVKVTATNLDGTNAAVVALISETSDII